MLPVNWTRLKENLQAHPLVRAFAISVLLHFIAFFVIEAGYFGGLWQTRAVPKWALKPNINPQDRNAAQKNSEPTVLQFIEVDPFQVTPEPPKDAKLYSTASTIAANPDTRVDVNNPKIDGSQKNVPKTITVSKTEPQPPPQPQPKPTKPQRAELQPDTKASTELVGDTKQNTLTPEEKAQRDLTFDKPAEKQTPRTRTLAQAREQKGLIEGPKLQQEGGVSKYALESSMDVKSSPFGSYDAQFIAAVQARWFDLLGDRVVNQSGRVVVEFRLNSDGRISQLRVTRNEVNETLSWMCQRAILDPAPYARFPADLKRILGADYREVRFTFHYN